MEMEHRGERRTSFSLAAGSIRAGRKNTAEILNKFLVFNSRLV
jgi:hypothetical protein